MNREGNAMKVGDDVMVYGRIRGRVTAINGYGIVVWFDAPYHNAHWNDVELVEHEERGDG